MKTKIDQKLKEIFGKNKHFADYLKIDKRDFPSKKKTVENRIKWLNKFLKPLNLKIEIVDISENETLQYLRSF